MKKNESGEEKTKEDCFCNKYFMKHHHSHNTCGSSNAIYGLGVIGALFYFLQNAHTFSAVMIGIGKAVFWPTILMFKLLTFLKM